MLRYNRRGSKDIIKEAEAQKNKNTVIKKKIFMQ